MSSEKKRLHEDSRDSAPPAAKRSKKKQIIDLGDLPSFISDPEADKKAEQEEIEKHGGRIRTLPVMAGHWPTHIYFSCSIQKSPLISGQTPSEDESDFSKSIKKISSLGASWTFFDPNDLHISLARTFSLRHHTISAFCKQLGEAVTEAKIGIISLAFDRWKFLVNDQKSTSFASLVCTTGTEQIISAIAVVDEIMRRFDHPTFYENPVIHASLAWAPIDLLSSLPAESMSEGPLNPAVELKSYITTLHCKVGKVLYSWPL
jgi:hypothetical protein